ncbi:MAG TPA: hypothetical protein V6D02_02100, partial [Candidatus Obscuribacterales bacterium]
MVNWFRKSSGLCAAVAIATLMGVLPAPAAEPLERQLNIRSQGAQVRQARAEAEQLAALGQQAYEAGEYGTAIAAWQTAIDLYQRLADPAAADTLSESLTQAYIATER